MRQKYEIIDVRGPENALEEQTVKDCKNLNRAIIKLVASCSGEIIGGLLMAKAMHMGCFAPIAIVFSATLIMASGQFQLQAITKLEKLYKKKGSEKVLYKENNLGEKRR